MLAGEELELLKHGYHKYFLVGYDCPKCGSCRSEQAFPPDRRINCPRCQMPEDASAVFLAPKPTRKAALSPGQRLTAAR